MRTTLLLIALLAALLAHAAPAHAAPATAFTYQGRLGDDGSSPTGPYDLRFRLFNSPDGSSQIGPTLCFDNVPVSAGVFAVTLDFGAAFIGADRYLEIAARADTGLGCDNAAAFVAVSPRQRVTPVPESLYSRSTRGVSVDDAGNAAINGIITAGGGVLFPDGTYQGSAANATPPPSAVTVPDFTFQYCTINDLNCTLASKLEISSEIIETLVNISPGVQLIRTSPGRVTSFTADFARAYDSNNTEWSVWWKNTVDPTINGGGFSSNTRTLSIGWSNGGPPRLSLTASVGIIGYKITTVNGILFEVVTVIPTAQNLISPFTAPASPPLPQLTPPDNPLLLAIDGKTVTPGFVQSAQRVGTYTTVVTPGQPTISVFTRAARQLLTYRNALGGSTAAYTAYQQFVANPSKRFSIKAITSDGPGGTIQTINNAWPCAWRLLPTGNLLGNTIVEEFDFVGDSR